MQLCVQMCTGYRVYVMHSIGAWESKQAGTGHSTNVIHLHSMCIVQITYITFETTKTLNMTLTRGHVVREALVMGLFSACPAVQLFEEAKDCLMSCWSRSRRSLLESGIPYSVWSLWRPIMGFGLVILPFVMDEATAFSQGIHIMTLKGTCC